MKGSAPEARVPELSQDLTVNGGSYVHHELHLTSV
jgi:hypothetical protein